MKAGLETGAIRAIAFDCFGTLIDWEAGILAALAALFERHRITTPPPAGDLLALYAELEARAQAGPYRPYREVLEEVAAGFAARLGFPLPAMDRGILADSIRHWPAFPDTGQALRRLKTKYKLAVISNIDDDLFERAVPRLAIGGSAGLDALVTAEQVRSYKPGHAHFLTVLDRLGIQRSELLIAACSHRHDIAPANELGIPSCWVDRRQHGASGRAQASPDLTVDSLAELADQLGC